MKMKIIALFFVATTLFTAACSTTYDASRDSTNSEGRFDQGIGDESLLG